MINNYTEKNEFINEYYLIFLKFKLGELLQGVSDRIFNISLGLRGFTLLWSIAHYECIFSKLTQHVVILQCFDYTF